MACATGIREYLLNTLAFFVFQGLPSSWAPGGRLIGPDESLLSKTLALYWSNFARSGDPNTGARTPLSANWPRFPAIPKGVTMPGDPPQVNTGDRTPLSANWPRFPVAGVNIPTDAPQVNTGARTPLSARWPRFPTAGGLTDSIPVGGSVPGSVLTQPRHEYPTTNHMSEYLVLNLPQPTSGRGRAAKQCAIIDALGPIPSPA